jgi:hypothetical protein
MPGVLDDRRNDKHPRRRPVEDSDTEEREDRRPPDEENRRSHGEGCHGGAGPGQGRGHASEEGGHDEGRDEEPEIAVDLVVARQRRVRGGGDGSVAATTATATATTATAVEDEQHDDDRRDQRQRDGDPDPATWSRDRVRHGITLFLWRPPPAPVVRRDPAGSRLASCGRCLPHPVIRRAALAGSPRTGMRPCGGVPNWPGAARTRDNPTDPSRRRVSRLPDSCLPIGHGSCPSGPLLDRPSFSCWLGRVGRVRLRWLGERPQHVHPLPQ